MTGTTVTAQCGCPEPSVATLRRLYAEEIERTCLHCARCAAFRPDAFDRWGVVIIRDGHSAEEYLTKEGKARRAKQRRAVRKSRDIEGLIMLAYQDWN